MAHQYIPKIFHGPRNCPPPSQPYWSLTQKLKLQSCNKKKWIAPQLQDLDLAMQENYAFTVKKSLIFSGAYETYLDTSSPLPRSLLLHSKQMLETR